MTKIPEIDEIAVDRAFSKNGCRKKTPRKGTDMKKFWTWIAAGSAFFLIAINRADASEEMTLDQAIDQNKVDAHISGTGASSGDSIRIKVRRKTSENLNLSLTPGTVFKNRYGGAQNMIGFAIKGEMVNEVSYRPSSTITLWDDNRRYEDA